MQIDAVLVGCRGEELTRCDPELWVFKDRDDGKHRNRFQAFQNKQGYTKEEFKQYAQVLTLFDGNKAWQQGLVDISKLLVSKKKDGQFGLLCGVDSDLMNWRVYEQILEAVQPQEGASWCVSVEDFESLVDQTPTAKTVQGEISGQPCGWHKLLEHHAMEVSNCSCASALIVTVFINLA